MSADPTAVPAAAGSAGQGPLLTSSEIAAAVGVSQAEAQRFWRALGLPDAGDQPGYTEADQAALTGLKAAVEGAGLDLGAGIRLARAVGQNVARLSEWQVAAIASRSDGPSVSGGETRRVTEQLSAALEQLLVHAWRRHVTTALVRLQADDQDETVESYVSVTVGFADLVSFSALSNELDTERLGALVEIFEARCADVIAANDGRMIKTLGDSVLFLADTAEAGLSIADGIIEVIGQDARLPDVSLGLATGEVVNRLGDVFGPPVNLAARLTALARRNRVLVDDATAARLDRSRYDVRRLTARPVRGFGVLEPIAVRRMAAR